MAALPPAEDESALGIIKIVGAGLVPVILVADTTQPDMIAEEVGVLVGGCNIVQTITVKITAHHAVTDAKEAVSTSIRNPIACQMIEAGASGAVTVDAGCTIPIIVAEREIVKAIAIPIACYQAALRIVEIDGTLIPAAPALIGNPTQPDMKTKDGTEVVGGRNIIRAIAIKVAAHHAVTDAREGVASGDGPVRRVA